MINFPSIKGCEFHEKAVKRIEDAFGNVRWSAVKKAKVTITSEFFGMNGDTASITVTSPSPFAPDPSNPSYKTYTWTVSVADEPNCTIEIPVESTIECYVSRDKANADSYVLLNGVKVVAGEGSYVLTVTTDVTIKLADEYSKGDFGKITIVEQGAEIAQPAVLKVNKITSDTYAGETTYTGEEFILLDIYPQPYATVSVTYGGVTKTITDTSGVENPNAQQVYFGTFNGATDDVATPASGTLTIKGYIQGFGAGTYKQIGSSAKAEARHCGCITGVTEWGEVDYIPSHAFYYCHELTSVSIPESVTSIGEYAFYSCDKLTSISIPAGVTEIGARTFMYCNGLVKLTLHEGLKRIGAYAFYSCDKLNNVVIPASVEYLGLCSLVCYIGGEYDLLSGKYYLLGTTPPEVATEEVGGSRYTPFNTGIVNASEFRIYVPKGCAEVYKNAWGILTNYIEEEK